LLETALNGRADAIVAFNRRHFSASTKQFGVLVLSPAAALEKMEN
jgi:hypothetical protein